MVTKQNATELREVQVRMEMLISYYRESGDERRGYVEELELRLRGVSEALRREREDPSLLIAGSGADPCPAGCSAVPFPIASK